MIIEKRNEAFIFLLKLRGSNRQSNRFIPKVPNPPQHLKFSLRKLSGSHPIVVFLIYKLVATLHKQFSPGQAFLGHKRGLLSPARRAAVPTPKRTLKTARGQERNCLCFISSANSKNHLSAAAASETPALLAAAPIREGSGLPLFTEDLRVSGGGVRLHDTPKAILPPWPRILSRPG